RMIGNNRDSNFGSRPVDKFRVGALKQKGHLERRSQRIEGLTAFVWIGIFHIWLTAIAPRRQGVAPTSVTADHGFRSDGGKALQNLAGLAQQLAGLDDIPVPVLLGFQVVFECHHGLGEKRSGAFLGGGRDHGREKNRQEPAARRNHWYFQATTPWTRKRVFSSTAVTWSEDA